MLKQPGEAGRGCRCPVVKEQKRQDYITHVLRIAQEGDFVRMDSDEEYVRIRDEVKQSAPRNRAPRAGGTLTSLPDKDRRIIKGALSLEDPLTARDVEYIRDGVCRMHIAHSYTAFFIVLKDCVRIVDVDTIERAHKKYKRLQE